jgi:hypothetical protein
VTPKTLSDKLVQSATSTEEGFPPNSRRGRAKTQPDQEPEQPDTTSDAGKQNGVGNEEVEEGHETENSKEDPESGSEPEPEEENEDDDEEQDARPTRSKRTKKANVDESPPKKMSRRSNRRGRGD